MTAPPCTVALCPHLRLCDARRGRVRPRGAAGGLARQTSLAGHAGGSVTDRRTRNGGAAAHGARGQACGVKDAARGLEAGDEVVRGAKMR